MRKLSILVGVCIAAISWGCATTPEPDEPEEPERSESVSLEREANTLTRARELIGVASPASLHVAYAEIRASDAAKTERGLELAYTAFKILQIAYPHALDDLIEVFPPAAGIGNRMFQEIEAGRYPEVETADVSYFTLLIPPLSILFTADVEVETRSLETIEQAMQVNPDSVLPVYLRGVIARRRGELVAAEGFFESALDKDSSCYPASVGAAEISLDTGDIDTANRHLESFREYIGADADITALAARIELESGHVEAAADIVVAGLGRFPDDVRLLLVRARLLAAEGSYNQAERFLSIAERSIPNNRWVLLLRGDLAQRKGEYDAAVEVFRRGMELYPLQDEFLIGYGESLIASGNLDEGRRVLNTILVSEPENRKVLRILLKDAVTTGRWEAAVAYAEMLPANGLSADLYELQFEAYRGGGNSERAAEAASRWYASAPDNSRIALRYAEALFAAERSQEAIPVIEAGLETARDPELRSRFYYLLSLVVEDEEQKLEALQSALFENLQNTDAIVALARTYAGVGNYRMAYRYMKQAVSLLPENEILAEELDEYRDRLP